MRITIMLTAVAALATSAMAVALPVNNGAVAECKLKARCNMVFTQCMEKGHPYAYCKCHTANYELIYSVRAHLDFLHDKGKADISRPSARTAVGPASHPQARTSLHRHARPYDDPIELHCSR